MAELSIADLRLRHEAVKKAREDAARAAREKDLGFAYVLGELETLIRIVEEKEKAAAAEDEAQAELDPLRELEALADSGSGVEPEG